MAILIAGVVSMKGKGRIFFVGVVLGTPAFFFILPRLFIRETSRLELISLGFIVPFFAYVTLTTLSRVLSGDKVTLDKLFGAAAVYLLMGLTWAMSYTVIEIIHPGNFFIPATNNPPGIMSLGHTSNWPDFLYFSFTTLTTLGYGDIHPISHQARSLAILEAASGVLYVAFLVARMVSMYQMGKTSDQ